MLKAKTAKLHPEKTRSWSCLIHLFLSSLSLSLFLKRKTLVQFQVMWVQTEVKASLGPRRGLLQETLWVLGGVLAEATVGLENQRISQDRSTWEAPTWILHDRKNLAFDLRLGGCSLPSRPDTGYSPQGAGRAAGPSLGRPEPTFWGGRASDGHLPQEAEPPKWQHGELGHLTQGRGLGVRGSGVRLHSPCPGE